MTVTGWRKSSRSAPADNCVEVANTLGAVRDSKNPEGGHLTASPSTLIALVKAGIFNRG